MSAYFADTAFWIALSSRRDQFHRRAVAWYAAATKNSVTLVTSEPVLWEWLNAFARPSSRSMAVEGYRRVHRDASIEVVPLTQELRQVALDLYGTRSDKEWSLTDCLSFVVMERLGLDSALTTDHHFEQAGFRALLLGEPQR